MKRKIMCAFVATSMAFSTVVSPIPIYGIGQVQAFAAEAREGETILDSGTMQVRIDNNFPRVIDYTLGDKVFYGQPNAIDIVEVNGYDKANSKWSSPKSIKVSGVTITKDGDKSATYTVPVKDGNIDSIVTVKITVENNTLSYDITNIAGNGSEKIQSIKIPNLSIVSVRNDQEGANFYGSVISNHVDVEQKGDRSVLVNESFTSDNKENKYMYGIVSNNELSASVWSNSDASRFNRVSTTSYKVGDVSAFGMGSSEWVYGDAELKVAEEDGSQPRPSLKVVITGDANGDSVINWNDGAIAYRDIMAEVKGSEDVPDQVAQRIAMNFGSMAANPFLKTLDNVKRVYLATDGLGQKVLLKGYQSEGHDSAHPDYDAVGERIGGVEDMRTLLDRGQEYGAVFGIHINAVETYPEAKAFSNELITDYGWNWIDAGYHIDTKYDWANGLRLDRLRKLKELGLNLNFLYTDAWGNGTYGGDNWAARRHAEEIKSVGYNVATEWADKMEDDAVWSHWATDLNYGGFDGKGINSEVARFIHNHQKDVWIAQHPSYAGVALNPLLGGYQLEGFEGWQANTDFTNYIKALYNVNLPTKFLQHYEVNYWEDDVDGREKEIRLINNETGDKVVVKRAGKPGASGLDASRIITLNGVTILEDNYSVESTNRVTDGNGKTYLAKGNHTEDVKYLIPWTWQSINGDENSKNDYEPKLYHWNLNGGTSTWDLPQEFQEGVKVYKLTDTGRVEADISSISGSRITLNAEPATSYILVKSDSTRTPKTITYGEKMHVVDPGFTAANLDAWNRIGSAELYRDYASNPMVKFTQPGDSISQQITDLEPNHKYTALVYVGNQSDTSNTVMEIQNGDETKSVYTEKSINKNYVKSDAHVQATVWDGNAWVSADTSYMQTMQVTFIAKSNTANLTLKRVLKDGQEVDDEKPSYLDDIRIVKSNSDYYPQDKQQTELDSVKYPVFYQDFENVERGIYPFVPNIGHKREDNRVHLAERNGEYTQRGWSGNGRFRPYMINDVIDGNWALKSHADIFYLAYENGKYVKYPSGLLFNTIPQNFRFEPGVTYDIEFDYECGSDGQYRFIYGSEEYSRGSNYYTEAIENTSSKDGPQTFKISITGDESGQTWFGIDGKLNGREEWKGNDLLTQAVASGAYDFVMDNLKITKTDKPPVDYVPDDPYKGVAKIESITATNAKNEVILDETIGEPAPNGAIANAFDRNPETYWHTKWQNGYKVELPAEIVIDLGKDTNIGKFEYIPRKGNSNGAITNFDFSYMKDGDNKYRKVAVSSEWEGDTSIKEVPNLSNGIKARYLKLTVNDSVGDSNGNHITAAEFLPYITEGEPAPEPEEPEDTDVIRIWNIKATNKDGDILIDQGGTPITNAIDADLNTQWHTAWSGGNINGHTPVEIVMDMGESYTMNKFDYVARQDGGINGAIERAKLSYSLNKTAWTDVEEKTFERTANITGTFEFPDGVQARYLKLTVYSTYGNAEADLNAYISAQEFIPHRFISKNEVLDDAVKDAQKVINDNGAKVDDVIKSIKDLSDAIVNYSKAEKSNNQ